MNPSYTMEERGFLALEYYKHDCYQKVKEQFIKTFPERPVPSNKTILKFFKKIRFFGCAEDKKYTRKGPVTDNDENNKKVVDTFNANPDWSIRKLSRETGISTSSCKAILSKNKIKIKIQNKIQNKMQNKRKKSPEKEIKSEKEINTELKL